MNKLRLVFEKGEAARYIGHLDVMRTFVRALRRANVPVKYTEGFNPHAVLSFALPLGVGTTSECEIADITLKNKLPVSEIIEKTNLYLQEGSIKILSGEYTDKPMPVIEKAEYIIDIKNDGLLSRSDIENALSKKEILIDKKTKRQTKQINIAEHIFQIRILDMDDNRLKLQVIVSAGNTFNIKPQLVVSALEKTAHSLNPCIAPHRVRFIFAR